MVSKMGQTRREFLVNSTVLGLGGAVGLSPLQKILGEKFDQLNSYVARKKNILFIAVDDLRPELGCYAHPMVKSPNIDSLAKTGVLFERTYCQQAVCGPSRASLLTGRRPDTTKIYDLKTHIRQNLPEVVTLQQHFKNNGYFSQGMGKLFHSAWLEDESSYSVPHDPVKSSMYVLASNLKFIKEGGKVTKGDSREVETTWNTTMRARSTECADVEDDAYQDGKIANKAIEALRNLAPKAKAEKNRKPFFLGVGFIKPHLPFTAPKKYWDLYDRSKITLPYPNKPKNAPDIAFTNWGELRAYSDIPDVGNIDEAMTKELIHGYYACVSFIDEQVGKLINELNRLDIRKDTIVIIWGDNGWKLGDYSQWCKHTNFEIDTHVPMIISDPDLPQGVRTNALTEFVDIFPTLTELCGLPLAEGLEGVSAVPLFTNPKRPWKKAAFSQYPRPNKMMGYSMRTDQYRYTEWVDQTTNEVKFTELYDLNNDPICKESLSLKPENAEVIKSLHEMMKDGWQNARPHDSALS